MAIIDADGFFNGDRMARLSLMARLNWPVLFLLGNAYGRLEINYAKIISTAYSRFPEVPTADQIHEWVSEYHSSYLLFLYQHESEVWGQWETSAKYLKKYADATSEKSPKPPHESLMEWREDYLRHKKSLLTNNGVNLLEKLLKNPPKTGHGIGVGEGVGIGVGKPISPPAAPDGVLSDSLFASLETPETPAAQPSLGTLQNERFENEFWPAYWRKVDKKAALKAFKKHGSTNALMDKIIAAVVAHAPYYLNRDPEHQPYAATWLNKNRYEEESPCVLMRVKITPETRRFAAAEIEKEQFERDYAAWEREHPGRTRDEFADFRIQQAERLSA